MSETITLPVEDVRRLCECNRELMEHLQSVDESATASMYGREYVDKAWARVAAALPAKKCPAPPLVVPSHVMEPVNLSARP